MKNLRHYISAAIIVNFLCISSAHALVVDFEEFIGVSGISNNFVAEPDLNQSSETFRLANKTYGASGGISFSGGILLQSPLDSMGVPIVGDSVLPGDIKSIYYGMAFSPSTSIATLNYTNTLTIDITSGENIKSVTGSFVHGLNTKFRHAGHIS